MKTIGSVLKRLLLALGGSASENYLNDITLVDRIAELAENGNIDPSVLQGGSTEQYSVGDIYISASSTSPAARFGGTWTQIKDTFLLAAGTNYAAGATGGEAAHTLTVNELAAHSHPLKPSSGLQDTSILQVSGSTYPDLPAIVKGADWTSSGYVQVGSSGGGQAHNNMPPYLAVYVWKRIA